MAVGETSLGVAHPLTTIAETDSARVLSAIETLVAEWKPVQLVVGVPLHADGTPHERTRLARRFAERLAGRFALPVAHADERLTSWEADYELVRQGVTGARRKAARDRVAAQRILQAYFDEHAP